MKLIINASPARTTVLTVVNGDDVIAEYNVFGSNVKSKIDQIFQGRYIEAVHFIHSDAYNQKFMDYIENNYQNVEVTW
jgi:hypothetical protein